MTLEKLMSELEKCGTMQNRKVYRKHGVTRDQFGVSFANLNVLKRRIRKAQDLAEALWATGNHDARILATMIADENDMTADLLETWAKDLDNYIISDSFAGIASRAKDAQVLMKGWMASDEEWICRAGWQMLAITAMRNPDLEDAFFKEQLKLIENNISGAKNRVKDAMNSALIAIGIRNESLKAEAIAAAKRIGKVEVNHGDTDCKTPEAVPYIENAWERRNAKKA
ncbi:DNA alkylation repair protein [bacterium]|nr:DNA alkylation repair protein [bacterium]MBU1881723.1 DNA alkylation repair protein [bacterium]